MNFPILFRTVVHLRLIQAYYQIKYRLIKPALKLLPAPEVGYVTNKFKTEPIPRNHSFNGEAFNFLNQSHVFEGWDYEGFGSLWTYNQNYFDWLNQSDMTAEEGGRWIDRFIEEVLKCPDKSSVSLDSYPIALRSINWIKFYCRYPECATNKRLDALYSQLRLLERKLEFHLLANHLLEDAFALYIGAIYFSDIRLLRRATHLLLEQLKEQILSDGSHFEQSPMYHCIILDRLLDAINISEDLKPDVEQLKVYAARMLGHLESIVWRDGSFPMFNDASEGVAPTPNQIFSYAQRLGIEWRSIPLKECGYRKLTNKCMEAIVDVGNITATYQPGHTHADVLNYELRVDGMPFVVDTGVSTYEKNARRLFERGTASHNCVVANGKSSSEVWGGFRVGRRCHTQITEINETVVEASHNGFSKECTRRFTMMDNVFVVDDWYDGEAISFIHFAEGVDVNRVNVEGATCIDINGSKYSTEYNSFHNGKVMSISFKGHLRYSIR